MTSEHDEKDVAAQGSPDAGGASAREAAPADGGACTPSGRRSGSDRDEDGVEAETDGFDEGAEEDLEEEPAPVRPTVRPASAKSYGPPQRRSGAHVSAPKPAEPQVFGVSVRAIALIAAIAVAVSLFASFAVSCGMQGMLQSAINADRHELESQIDERLTSSEAQVNKIIDEYNSAAQAASSAQDADADLTKAREDLRQTMADARAWLASGDGQWVSSQTETMMRNALDAAQNLIDERGISDPQTYRDAAESIEDIIDDVDKGALW